MEMTGGKGSKENREGSEGEGGVRVCARTRECVCPCVRVRGEKERMDEHVAWRNEERQRERKAVRERKEGVGGGSRGWRGAEAQRRLENRAPRRARSSDPSCKATRIE